MSSMGLKNTDGSFINDEGIKTQMTKEEILKAEKEKIENLKKELKKNGMDDKEIENQIKMIMDADKINKTKDGDDDEFSEPMHAGDDMSSVRRGLNIKNANSNSKRKSTAKNNEFNDFELSKTKDFALEINESEKKSMKSENFRAKAKLTGVPDFTKVRESIDKIGISTTDDRVLINATKVNKNPKLETTHKLGALASVDFDSEKQVN